ncbi:MAG: hypothetical protein E6J45_04490 [Chloroflexi bacterium]|nr:MAG: hypothetical protein E6J45_04490 [Chloroflexota bacterium]
MTRSVVRAACVLLTAVALQPGVQATAASGWWQPLGLRGTSLAGVDVAAGAITVRTTSGATLQSTDSGATFTGVPGNPPLAASPAATGGADTWSISPSGQVLRAQAGGAPRPDRGAPQLGAGARLIAALPGVAGAVVAVASSGAVWRRTAGGAWNRALLLLPAGLVRGVPSITALTAFDRPLTETVYLATDGYAVLISSDGGDDWIRAGPGLPDSVHGLATDARARSVYAATSDGLWVHRLQSFPSPPVYRDTELLLRWVGIALVAALAAVAAVLAMVRLVPRA